jgi:hypothetical protein
MFGRAGERQRLYVEQATKIGVDFGAYEWRPEAGGVQTMAKRENLEHYKAPLPQLQAV